jgi:hypothetical protein
LVEIRLVKGRKGEGDILPLLTCHNEPLSFSDLLFVLSCYFRSEDSYYSRTEGFEGRVYLMKAILEIYSDLPFDRVLKRYQLPNKTRMVR